MKTKRHPKEFVIAIANRTEAHIFCDEMLGVERPFRNGIQLDHMTANEKIASKIHAALEPLLAYHSAIQPRARSTILQSRGLP